MEALLKRPTQQSTYIRTIGHTGFLKFKAMLGDNYGVRPFAADAQKGLRRHIVYQPIASKARGAMTDQNGDTMKLQATELKVEQLYDKGVRMVMADPKSIAINLPYDAD